MDASLELALYVAGDAPNSSLARANLEALCRELPRDRCRIEIVDVLLAPERALSDGVMLTPMLIRRAPAPQRRMFGNLSDRRGLASFLGLELP